MAESSTDQNSSRDATKLPDRSATSPRFEEPVIISGNRFNDIAPYVSNIYEADPMRWGAVLPWEFPQHASREVEEAFVIKWFGEHEVHMQGGATHEGAGFRFLKQVWYTIAIWNFESRVPLIARWWWEHPGNQYLIEDPYILQWICHPDVIPRTIFSPETVKTYPHKILIWVIPLIQQFAAAKLEADAVAAAAGSMATTRKSGAKSDSAIDHSVPVELSPRAQSLHVMESSIPDDFTDKPSESLQPDAMADAGNSAMPAPGGEPQQSMQDEKSEVANGLPAVGPRDQSTTLITALDPEQSVDTTTMQTPLHAQLGASATIHPSSTVETRTPTYTPLRASNAVFVPRNAPAGQPPLGPSNEFYNQGYGYTMLAQPFAEPYAPYAQDQNNFGVSHGVQSGYPEYSGHRGARGGRRGSRGEGARRMSRGGRDGNPRGRLGSSTFDNTAAGIEHHPPPQHLMHVQRTCSPYVPPSMQARHGSYQQPMNVPYSNMGGTFQQQAPRAATYPEHVALRQASHGQRPYVPPNVTQPHIQPDFMGASKDPRCNDVSKDYIGSNRTEVNQLVIFQCPVDFTQENLEQLFGNIGVSGVTIDLRPKNTAYGPDQQFVMAFARFRTHDEARHGLMLNGHQIGQRRLVVEVSKEFWDASCPRYHTRYRAASQASATSTHVGQQHPSARPERNLTPRTIAYESSNDGNDAPGPHRRMSAAWYNKVHPQASVSSQIQARVLPTQDARLMEPSQLSASTAEYKTPVRSTEKEASPKKQKLNKNRKKSQQNLRLSEESGVAKGIQDKTNQRNDRSNFSGEQTTERQEAKPTVKSVAKHKTNGKEHKQKAESTSAEITSKIADQKPGVSTGLSPTPAASVEQPLKVSKRIATTTAEISATVQSTRLKVDEKAGQITETTNVTKEKQDLPTEVEASVEKQHIVTKSPSASADTAPVVAGDAQGLGLTNMMVTLADNPPVGDSVVDEARHSPVTTTSSQKVATTKKEPGASGTARPIRVITPMRAVSFKPDTPDDAAPTPTQVASKKAADVVTSSRKGSETSIPPTPASIYTTAPPTPLASEFTVAETSKEQATQKAQEKPKGPSQTESLSMFGKKQSKSKKKDAKGKDTVKEKPKEFAKLAEEEATKSLAEASTTASKGKQKAHEATQIAAAETGNALKQKSGAPPVGSPVTSPNKRKLGPLSSLFGLLSRQPASTAPSLESPVEIEKSALEDKQATEPVGVFDTKNDSEGEESKPTDQVEELQDCVSQDIGEQVTKPIVHEEEVIDRNLAEACRKAFEYSQQASAVLLKSPSVNTLSSLQSMKECSPEVVCLGLSGVRFSNEAQTSTEKHKRKSKGKQRAKSTSSSGSDVKLDTPSSSHRGTEAFTSGVGSPQPMFERDKAEEGRSESSRTVSAQSSPSDSPPAQRRVRGTKDHLVEAPQPRNAHKRRIHRPHSTSTHTILNSEDIIPARSPERASSLEGSGNEEAKVNFVERLTLYNLENQNQPDVFVPAQDSRATLYIIYPPVLTPLTSTSARPASWEEQTESAQQPSLACTPYPPSQAESSTGESTLPAMLRRLGSLTDFKDSDTLFVSRSPSLSNSRQADNERTKEVKDSDDGMSDLEELGPESD